MNNDYIKDLKSWKENVNTLSTLIVGVDISRSSHDACFGNREDVFRRKLKFSSDSKGFNKFMEVLTLNIKINKSEKVLIGMEPTSIYWYPFSEFLKSQNIKAGLVSPVAVSHNRKTMSKGSGKTDPKDAFCVYDLLRQGKFFFTSSPSSKHFCSKMYLKRWMNAKKSLVQAQNQMRSSLSLFFPEFEVITYSTITPKVLLFLEKYPTPASIVAYSEKSFSLLDIKGWSQGELKEIFLLAKRSVGISTYYDKGKIIIKEHVLELKSKLEEENNWFERCNMMVKDEPGYKHLQKIKGLGEKIITGLMISFGDFNKYSNGNQLIKLAGLDIIEKTSGTSIRGISRISYQGNSTLRYWAYMGASQVVQYTGPFRTKHLKKKARRPGRGSGKKSLIAVSDKLIRVTWRILKGGEEYQEDYDNKTRSKYK